MDTEADDEEGFVSTGRLPPSDWMDARLAEAHRRYAERREGARSGVYPALARVPPELFGICLVGIDGRSHSVGDAEYEFAIMSISKPFVFALVCQALGPES